MEGRCDASRWAMRTALLSQFQERQSVILLLRIYTSARYHLSLPSAQYSKPGEREPEKGRGEWLPEVHEERLDLASKPEADDVVDEVVVLGVEVKAAQGQVPDGLDE